MTNSRSSTTAGEIVLALDWHRVARLIAAFLAMAGAKCMAQTTIDDIVAAQAHYFSQIQTVDLVYTAQDTLAKPSRSSSGMTAPQQIVERVRFSESKFRVDTFLDGAEYPPKTIEGGEVVAYDLQKYQYLDKSTMEMLVQQAYSERGYGNVFLLQAYEPIIPEVNHRTFDALKNDKSVWEKFRHAAQIGAPVQFAGKLCIPVTVSRSNRVHHCWYLDSSLYPIGYENYHPSGPVAGRYAVSETQTVSTPQGAVIVPLAATWDWYTEMGEQTTHYVFATDKRGILINQPVSEDIFTLDRSVALEYQDRDDPSKSYNTGRTRTKRKPSPARAVPIAQVPATTAKMSPLPWVLVITLGLLLCVLGGWVVLLKRQTTRPGP